MTVERGFTIVELLVAMSILALMMAIGVPSLSSYLQAAKLSSAANSYHAGMQTARQEAVRRNQIVEFVMTNSPIVPGTIANNVVPAAAGVNWIVRAPDLNVPANFVLLESKSGLEGASTGNAVIQATGSSTPAGFNGTVAFNGFGVPVLNGTPGASFSIDLSNPAGGLCVGAGGPMRCPRIRVSTGGQISNCDPAAAASDTRACPP